ncbi:MAG: hypothetical protein NTU53_11725 [Planctomycetota bacterium]|nr:hypothetical protein [Planctomycetota bacterium]
MKREIRDNSRLIKRFPELAFFSDPSDRYAAFRTAMREIRWRYFLLAAVFSSMSCLVVPYLVRLLLVHLRALLNAPHLHSVSRVVVGVCNGLIPLVIAFVLVHLFRKRIQRSLRSQLVARGTPICVECGYDLRGQLEPRCPECGKAFDPSLIQCNREQQ